MNNKEKIGYLIDVNFERGGAPISTKVLAEGICTEYNVCIIKPYNKNEKETEIQVLPIEQCIDEVPYMLFHPIKWLKLCRRLEKIINSSDYRILHSHMPNVGMAIGYLRLRKRIKSDIKLVYSDREHVPYLKKIHRIRYDFFIAKQYDAIITLSEVSLNYWENKVKHAIVKKIYNTASKEFENYFFEKKTSTPLKIIMVGRIVSDKGWPLAIEIIKKCPEYNYTLVISYFNDEQKKDAYNLIDKICDLPNVKIFFNLSLSEVKKLYQKVDILVMTSEKESFGRTAVEAMSQGCAVIGTQVGGLPEVIGKSENCLPREEVFFCKKLRSYEKNQSELEKDKQFFYHRYVMNFSHEQYIKKHYELYKSILD